MAKSTKTPELKYFFTVEPRIETIPVGEVPGGFRVDLRYLEGGPSVTTDGPAYAGAWLAKLNSQFSDLSAVRTATAQTLRPLHESGQLEWQGIEGTILSGTDWATVRSDGVISFDGRATIRTDDEFLIDAVVSGVVDLRPRTTPMTRNKSREVYTDWLNGGLKHAIPVSLAVHFEAAENVESWANNKIKKASEAYWKYERLVRGNFVALGDMTLQNTAYSPISTLILDIYEVTAV